MKQIEIKEQLDIFKQNVFNSIETDTEYWKNLKEQLDSFVKENNLTTQDLKDFVQSGAGELLYMMCGE